MYQLTWHLVQLFVESLKIYKPFVILTITIMNNLKVFYGCLSYSAMKVKHI